MTACLTHTLSAQVHFYFQKNFLKNQTETEKEIFVCSWRGAMCVGTRGP